MWNTEMQRNDNYRIIYLVNYKSVIISWYKMLLLQFVVNEKIEK